MGIDHAEILDVRILVIRAGSEATVADCQVCQRDAKEAAQYSLGFVPVGLNN